MSPASSLSLDGRAFVAQLDGAVQRAAVADTVRQVKSLLEETFRRNLRLADRYRQPHPERYARRLLHRNIDLGYTAVVMTWGPGQRTGLHDHAGIWCVEVVAEGQMRATRYDLARETAGVYAFVRQDEIDARVGDAGSLIPPFEYHVLANAQPDATSVTLHVYGGEMDRCNLYVPRGDGTYERQDRALSYDS